MGQIRREVLRFCITLLDHLLQDNEYESAIISGLAVLGIKEDKGWLNAEDYTLKYSAVIKLARLMVIQEAYKRRQERIRMMRDHGASFFDEMVELNGGRPLDCQA